LLARKLLVAVLAMAGALAAGPRAARGQAASQPAGVSAASRPATGSAPAAAPRQRWYEYRNRPLWLRLGSLDAKEYPFELWLTTEGAAVGTLKLSAYYATVGDKKLAARYKDDHDGYLAEAAANPTKYHGHYSLLNPVKWGGRRYLPFATRSLSVWVPGANVPQVWPLEGRHWRLVEAPDTAPSDSQSVRLAWTLHHDPGFADPNAAPRQEPFLTVTKTYTVRKDDYSLAFSLEVTNHSDQPLKVTVEQYGPTGVPKEGLREDQRMAAVGKLREGKTHLYLKPGSDLEKKMKLGELERVGYTSEPASGQSTMWIGHINQFFGSMMYLLPADANRLDSPDVPVCFSVGAIEESAHSRAFLTAVTIGAMEKAGGAVQSPVELAANGGSYSVAFDVFAGPKKRDMFSDSGAPHFKKLYKDLDYLSTISFRACFCSWSALSLGMMWLLQALSSLALGNYGVAIIVLVVLMRIVLHPLSKKSQVMMSKTQKLAPQMQKLKEKYADDKQAMQREMMTLYKQQGFTPLLGCLPMLLQMPIWIALWSALNAAVELRHAAFLPVWLTDLAAPDALVKFSSRVPLLGTSFNLLPILVAISMFLQTKLNPQMSGASPAATPEQQRQQKMMQYMMPVMMLFIFYSMPSGLTLYIMTSTFAGVAEQYLIRKHIRAKEAAEAARVTTVRVPGKASRASRPKKPKGPMWFKRG